MIENTHSEMVTKLAKPGSDIQAEMTFNKLFALWISINEVLDSGTRLELAKKAAIYNKPLDIGVLVGVSAIDPECKLHLKNPEDFELLHMAVGIAGESIELLESIFKTFTADSDKDMVNLVEELGDLEFFMEGFRKCLGIKRLDTLSANIDKLSKRYATGSYSNKQAQDRADKQVDNQNLAISEFGDREFVDKIKGQLK